MDRWWVWVIAGYLCGSIPFSLLIGRAHGIDIRAVGSGNVGATNLARALGKKWGWMCFLLDAAKGMAPVLLAGCAMGLLGETSASEAAWKWLAVGVAAVVGHVFPIWLRFRGGKGVATGLGVLLGYWPVLTVPAAIAAGVWITLLGLLRYVSVASMGAAIAVPLGLLAGTLIRHQRVEAVTPFLLTTSVLATLVVVRHWPNIKRLAKGTEHKIGRRRLSPGTGPVP